MVAVGLQQRLGQVEVRVGVVAVADLLHRQAEDGRRQANAFADGHGPEGYDAEIAPVAVRMITTAPSTTR